MKKVPRIVGIGIAVVDIYRHQKKMYPGGNEYNVAYDTKLLGQIVRLWECLRMMR